MGVFLNMQKVETCKAKGMDGDNQVFDTSVAEGLNSVHKSFGRDKNLSMVDIWFGQRPGMMSQIVEDFFRDPFYQTEN